MNAPGTQDSFQQRIPNLSSEELLAYLHNYRKFRKEAISIALEELKSRNEPIDSNLIIELNEYISPNGTPGENAATFNSSFTSTLINHAKHIYIACFAIAIVGFAAIRAFAVNPEDNPLGYNPLNTKKYLSQLEEIGGKANIMSAEFMDWFNSLWHGKKFATTFLILFSTLGLIFILINKLNTTPKRQTQNNI